MKIAVIPARGGSKRIPRKNIKDFCGKPMIAWSIEAAISSGCFDRVIVSTDDEEIAEVSSRFGAEIPFLRPLELSDDVTGTTPVIAHAVTWVEEHIGKLDLACCVYATAPFICIDDLRAGLSLMKPEISYAFTVTRYSFPIQRAIKLSAMNEVEMFQPHHFATRSQDLEEAFHDAGQFYWGRAEAWKEQRVLFSKEARGVILPSYRVQDIDTDEDWLRAEWMFRAQSASQAPNNCLESCGPLGMSRL